MAEYRTVLVLSFFYKFWLGIQGRLDPSTIPMNFQSATQKLYQVKKEKKNFFVIRKMIFLKQDFFFPL